MGIPCCISSIAKNISTFKKTFLHKFLYTRHILQCLFDTAASCQSVGIQPQIQALDINIKWLNGNKASYTKKDHHSSTAAWSPYRSAGEPMITLWIRMPCVTSGKDGSLSFNSAMMLKQRDETEPHMALVPALHSVYIILQEFIIYLCVSVSIITPMYRRFISDSPNQESWKKMHKNGICKNNLINMRTIGCFNGRRGGLIFDS